MKTNRNSNAWWFWVEGWSLFGAFAVLGGISILAAHALLPEARWPAAIFAVLLMLAFGFSEYWYKQGQEDRLGDNLYYLGLTYTLVSVAHALYAFTGVANVDQLVSDFSVALLTTLVGIVGRVLLYERHASQKPPAGIDDEILRLRAETEGAVKQMQEFRHGLALYLQQATDNAVQSLSTAFTSFSVSANEMGEAAKAMNASLKRGASAFDKTFGRIGEASDALGERASELVEGTKVLKSVSEDLNGVMGSLKKSVEQQSSALTATLEPLKETARGIRTELESLKGSVSPLAGSVGELTQQIETAKEEISLVQLKTSLTHAHDAAENLGRNLRSVADAVSPVSVDANISVLKKFAGAITDLTMKVEDCTRNLVSLAERPNQVWKQQHQLATASNDGSVQHDPKIPAGSDSSSGTRANGSPPGAAQNEGAVGGSLTIDTVELNSYSRAQDHADAENRDSTQETRSRAWWSWHRG
jgi:methyl-accepting chemotaxis protein